MENRIKTLLEFFLLIVLHLVCFLRWGRCSAAIYGSRGASRLRRNYGNFGCGVMETHIFGRSTGKFLVIREALKGSPVFRLARKLSRWKYVFHLEVFKRIHQQSARRAIHGDICAASLDYGERGTNGICFKRNTVFTRWTMNCPLAFLCPRGLFCGG